MTLTIQAFWQRHAAAVLCGAWAAPSQCAAVSRIIKSAGVTGALSAACPLKIRVHRQTIRSRLHSVASREIHHLGQDGLFSSCEAQSFCGLTSRTERLRPSSRPPEPACPASPASIDEFQRRPRSPLITHSIWAWPERRRCGWRKTRETCPDVDLSGELNDRHWP